MSRKRTVIALFFLISISTLGWFLNSVYSKTSYWRALLLSQLNEIVNVDLEYKEEKVKFFPNPGIELHSVSVSDHSKVKSFDIELDKIVLTLSWTSLLKREFKLGKVSAFNGNISAELPGSDTKSSKSPHLHLSEKLLKLQINQMHLENIDIKLTKGTEILDFNLRQIDFHHNSTEENSFVFDLDYNKSAIEGNFEFGVNDYINPDDIFFNGNLHLTNFPLYSIRNIYQIFTKSDFNSGLISGSIAFSKVQGMSNISFINKLKVSHLNFKDLPQGPSIEINGGLLYNYRTHAIDFQKLNLKRGNQLKGTVTGELRFAESNNLHLNIIADYIELNTTLPYIMGFLDFKLPNQSSGKDFIGHLTIETKSITYLNFKGENASIELKIVNKLISLDIKEVQFLGGVVHGNGTIGPESPEYNFHIQSDNIQSNQLISFVTDKPHISGNMDANFDFRSSGNTFQKFLSNLESEGNVLVHNGNLVGYANFYKPILTLGKFINFRGPKGDSTEFQSLEFNFSLESKTIHISNFKITGVGFDAKGKGYFDFDSRINLQIQVGLGGFAGKAIYIPIVYKGKMGENFAYIDPVWLGSVYLGATLLGGPAGMTAGGIAGSAISEYVQGAVDKFKGLFNFDKKDKREGNE
ncbi:MAG: AsmA family protein [Leptospiraceae bacterium]|nr:AsmA family protein [Leptospiraceae bacterium]MCP5512784.1 AsmA family protein [Leptospiraceae bacterium]